MGILHNIAGWFQPAYDSIEDWDWSPEMKKRIAKLNSLIPKVVRESIKVYLKDIYKYGDEYAQKELNKLKDKISQI